MKHVGFSVLTAVLLATSASAQAAPSEPALERFATDLGYRYTVVDNRPDCPGQIKECFLATISLTVPDSLPALAPGWSLYFSFPSRLPLVESDTFQHELVNGDLQRLTLKPGKTLRPGSTHVIKLWGVGSNFSKAYAMPNAYVAAPGLRAHSVAASQTRIDPDSRLELLPFVAPMTDEARLVAKTDADQTRWMTAERTFAVQAAREAPVAQGVVILPKPANAVQRDGARVDLTRGVTVALAGVDRAAIAPALAALGVPLGGGVPLAIRVNSSAPVAAEGYVLEVGTSGIEITARDAAGASHALRSLAQQAAFEKGSLRPLRVEDAPHYGFRGLHIDVARNFHGRDELLKLVEAMAVFKLNKLHLHLADDEGWRIEVPALPELTQIGSKRCHDPQEQTCLLPQLGAGPEGTSGVNGFLTTADYIAIVKAAAARQIEVIPSIDTPGHSRAAIVSMEARRARLLREGKTAEADRYRLIDPADRTQYRSIQNYNDNTLNVCIPATYRFVDTVVDALAAAHQQAGVPLRTFHLGADETAGAWVNSPACAAMIAENGGDARQLTPRFIERFSRSLAAKGIKVGGWSDGLGHTDAARMPKSVQTNIWGLLHTGGVRETNEQMARGWDVVLSMPTFAYLDMPYAPHPDEGGYDWGSRGTDTYQVFSVMPDNLPANAAIIKNLNSQPATIADEPTRPAGRTIAGLQAQLWSETVRTDNQVDYMLFPRLLAIAERAWTPASWSPPYQPGAQYQWQDQRVALATLQSEWKNFAGRVAAQLPLLDRLDVAYRVAPPGAKLAGGMLNANSAFPGTAIEYRVGTGAWQRYTAPVAVSGPVELRSRSADGQRTSRVVLLER